MELSRYQVADELTGKDVQFDTENDILVKLTDPNGVLPTIYIDGTPVDSPEIDRVVRVLTGLRF